ncbi:TIGR01212 family radical SAM protein [Propionivibrio sp.]|uniref:TIGR01212 family radical SAM protein n=1 Tax=Propionivibrio sp. TaxID=2212460 RepID=UPI0025E0E9F9|nr:TIGR01212 family radical SAM protein [Propionivibrio sp.]MBK7357264.1 TIGR01212 family radical SAM protein [Propionivibrio sp.]MBK8401339.1 TIGR01212 family radical SAM protein [Propionivibrio sp.]MBK8745991.1 TIGR01212 family radical SAM protein [Propionivibrio sp.]MBK8892565.1 TIGR01212 family radical SAM protein [Propionivibrio sp.]MBL0208692.1 TIGR01212 family radical SAM protein [Propionivibrio sp.]
MNAFDECVARFFGHRYHAYNDWAKHEYGGRLQKVSIDAGFTCPNRDGSLGIGGCTYCNNEGFSPSYLLEQRDIFTQIDTGIEFMRRRYPKTKAFIAYFQSYSNTYDDLDALKQVYGLALSHPDIAGIAIGTRPDCLPEETLDYLAELATRTMVELEIGIESCNDDVLEECLRGHDFACTQDAIRRAAKRDLFVTGHLLLGLPLESRDSLIAGARALAALPLDALKFHQLQIVRGTRLANLYRAAPDSISLLTPESYLDAVIDMLELLPPGIKIQRLGSEVPPSVLVSPDWGMRLFKFPAMLEAKLEARNTWQGRLYCAHA